MPSSVSILPPEVLGFIHQQLMDGAASSPAKEALPVRPSAAGHLQPDRIRQAAVARQNFAAVNRRLRDIDKANLALPENSAVGTYVTRATISSLAKCSADQFGQGVAALLDGNPHIDVDFSQLSAEQSAVVLDVLDRVQTGTLHEVRLRARLDPNPGSEALMSRIDQAITRMRDTHPDGRQAKFAFDCFGADAIYANTPDFRQWANLTSVTLLRCGGLTAALDFSSNRGLTEARLIGCRGQGLTAAPDFSSNPELRRVVLGRCLDLVGTPDFSSNLNLREVNLSGCIGLTVAPDFSGNPALTEVVLVGCLGLTVPPGFSLNPELRRADFNGCLNLAAMPDFSSNPKLRSTDFSNCMGLLIQPGAASNPYLAEPVRQMQRQLASRRFLQPSGG